MCKGVGRLDGDRGARRSVATVTGARAILATCAAILWLGVASGAPRAQDMSIGPFVTPMSRALAEPRIADDADAETAPENAFPFVASILLRRTPPLPPFRAHFCGGVLVRKNWVLTAAHCLQRVSLPDDIFVVVGGGKLSEGGEVRKVGKIERHANYVLTPFNTLMWDFALLKLTENSTKRPVALLAPSDERIFMTENPGSLFVVGWGQPFHGGPDRTMDLKLAELVSVTNTDCKAKYGFRAPLIDETIMFCATKPGGGDACKGDSGGPLMVFHDELNFKPHVVGLVSWGLKCGADTPGVYARLSAAHQWIESIVNQ